MYAVTVWIAEGFLAFFFLLAGLPKIVGRGIDRWVGFDDVPRAMTVVIGLSEVCAAVGLVVPLLSDAAEWTTPLAAVGIAVISLMACGFHIRNHEWLAGLETALWSSLAASVAIARWGELSTGPSLHRHDLVPVLLALVPVVVANLVVLTIRTAPAPAPSDEPARSAEPAPR